MTEPERGTPRDEAERLIATLLGTASVAARRAAEAGRNLPVSQWAEFAGRLLAEDEASRPAPDAPPAGATGPGHRADSCCACPICRLISTLRDPSPEFAARLATGASDIAAGVTNVLRAFGDAWSGTGSAGNSSPADPWHAATAGTGPDNSSATAGTGSAGSDAAPAAGSPPGAAGPAPARKPMAKKATRPAPDAGTARRPAAGDGSAAGAAGKAMAKKAVRPAAAPPVDPSAVTPPAKPSAAAPSTDRSAAAPSAPAPSAPAPRVDPPTLPGSPDERGDDARGNRES